MKKGWFAIPGVQKGDRTIEEQMQGLQPVVKTITGKTVLDVGCAEGLISLELLKAGAAVCHGVDSNHDFIEEASRLSAGKPLRVQWHDLNQGLPSWCDKQYDVVLALAILHKVHQPESLAAQLAARARMALVVRLPIGSHKGRFINKQQTARCDLNRILPRCGLHLAETLKGPRGEWVQHWRRA